MNLAVIQMASQADIATNLATATRLLEQAAVAGAKLAVLPENFAAMGRSDLARVGRDEAEGLGQSCHGWRAQPPSSVCGWSVAPCRFRLMASRRARSVPVRC